MPQEMAKIEQKVIITAKPEAVYNMYVDARKHSELTGSRATSQPRVGGKITAWDGYAFGKYLKLEKGKKIVQNWKTTEWPKGYPPSILEITLKPEKRGTELTMVQSNVPAEQAADYRQGWIDFYWKPLQDYFKAHSEA